MNKKLISTKVLLVAVFAARSAWAGETDDIGDGGRLGKALQEHMLWTYACQQYLGGSAQYRAAKLLSIETYARVTQDRNAAVLAMDKVEQEIKKNKADERLAEKFAGLNLSYVESVGVCQDLTADSMDKVQVMQAKLNLL
ncbi:hypothetical protein [Sinorhizobium fredii]|uniref:hypothetical protein n=1 Tax=Rhizobium fredii TaxID=380 RepID=UPI0004B5C5A2|nr:hypothetical protein [Sinorhizobium fredii]